MIALPVDDLWHALDSPWSDPDDWADEITVGRCGHCGGIVHIGRLRAWHIGEFCRPSASRELRISAVCARIVGEAA